MPMPRCSTDRASFRTSPGPCRTRTWSTATAPPCGWPLARSHPALEIAGSHHGCADLDSPQNERLIEDINARSPDIVLVGMATPKQELWMERCAGRLGADVVWTVGGLLDELAGRTPRVPRAVADAGLEWAFRLAADPRGQWRRGGGQQPP